MHTFNLPNPSCFSTHIFASEKPELQRGEAPGAKGSILWVRSLHGQFHSKKALKGTGRMEGLKSPL